MRRLPAALLLLAVVGLWAVVGWRAWRARGISPVQRGFVVASTSGCFGCHGVGGLNGFDDPDGRLGAVPPFSREALLAHAKNEGEIREWILDGAPRRLRAQAAEEEGEPSLLRMPAWRGVLTDRQVADLVAYVKAVSDYERPDDPAAERGRQAAERLACFGCHGPQGRGSMPNPRSFKGYIPAWDGTDFGDVAKDDGEIREWIVDGSPRRLRAHPVARFFMRRQAVQMPAYGSRLAEGEVDALVAYIRWLRREARSPGL
ncbi:MAG TPA: c-type cytochrome [Vicinamibacteria bacterium]|nr:c-type cytochrome [Vicinamibacteria bacterium]